LAGSYERRPWEVVKLDQEKERNKELTSKRAPIDLTPPPKLTN